MPAITAMPTLTEMVAQAVEAYRALVAGSPIIPAATFVAEAKGDPGSVASEVVDYASDQLGMVIDYDWNLPHTLRDQVYRNAWTWADGMTDERLSTPYGFADVEL